MIQCTASVCILYNIDSDTLTWIRGSYADPYLIGRYLYHNANDSASAKEIIKYGDFDVLPKQHYESPHNSLKIKVVGNRPKVNNRTISLAKLKDFCDNGGHTYSYLGDIDDGEDPTECADSFFYWNGTQWEYLTMGYYHLKHYSLAKVLKNIDSLMK